MELFIIALGAGAAVLTLVTTGAMVFLRGRPLMLEDVDDDHVKSAHQKPYGPAVLATKPPRHAVTIASGGGRRDGPSQWVASGTAPRAGAAARFFIEPRTLWNRSPIGAVKIADAFDRRYSLDGDRERESTLRARFTDATVVAALDALFDDDAPISVALDADGAFTARWGLSKIDVRRAQKLALASARFLEVLEARVEPAPDAAGTGSSSTGAPVAVPAASTARGRSR